MYGVKHAVYPGFPGSLVEVVASRWLWVHGSQKEFLSPDPNTEGQT